MDNYLTHHYLDIYSKAVRDFYRCEDELNEYYRNSIKDSIKENLLIKNKEESLEKLKESVDLLNQLIPK
jgi:hypothetical protein